MEVGSRMLDVGRARRETNPLWSPAARSPNEPTGHFRSVGPGGRRGRVAGAQRTADRSSGKTLPTLASR
jgi:hypothetical protein